ncbi:hypothetical protein GCM10023200_19430 [Actinomycetospora chlora]|uniref:Uncharacterized protein n=1 Tax=Actinomycetospora chlora TaxID=663608 RepID=A0ABP9ATB2_9PSEU
MRHDRATGSSWSGVVGDGVVAMGVPVVGDGAGSVVDAPDVGGGTAVELDVEVGVRDVVVGDADGLLPPVGWQPARTAHARTAPAITRATAKSLQLCIFGSP